MLHWPTWEVVRISGGEAGRGLDEREARPGARRLWPGRWHGDSPERHLPQPGMEVGGYRLEAKLGTGGQGTVFRARREGRLYAVKFIYLPHSAHWAWRELGCMVRLWRAGSLPLEGHGQWPARQPRFLFIVTPYVRGSPLDQWVREKNPTAREVAQLVKGAASELEGVHAAGVVHRDVKGANFMVRQEDGHPVLVDFGVGTYEGAPEATGPFPPGTWSYLSPQVWRAWRETGHHRATPGDDVWALGVELYWMLTGTLPFQGREGELVDAILHQEPRAPHELNPRVPRALGEVCLRMLRKELAERYADARAVREAVDAELEKVDAAWEVPLCEAWGP
ncbi:MAG: serine/threonine-protein kinase, partial [Archangium sp.]